MNQRWRYLNNVGITPTEAIAPFVVWLVLVTLTELLRPYKKGTK